MTNRIVVEGRRNVAKALAERVKNLMREVDQIIRGKESEYLFHVVYLYQSLAAALAKKTEIKEIYYTIYDISWFRFNNALTLALNEILPRYLPIKHPRIMSVKKLDEIFGKSHYHLLITCLEVGLCYHILKNQYVNRVEIEDGTPKPFFRNELLREYISKLLVNKEHAYWQDRLYREIGNKSELKDAVSGNLERLYGFNLDDLLHASQYLENLVKNNRLIIRRNELRAVFTGNIRSYRADRFLGLLEFRKDTDLYRSPLIPVRPGHYLIAGWVFSFGMHFASWFWSAVENTGLYGTYANFVGDSFVKYVEDKVRASSDALRSLVTLNERDFPEIKPWLRKMKKTGMFEVDMVISKGHRAFLVSCKGGRKNLPKLHISKVLAEFSEKEVMNKVRENQDDLKEILLESQCIASSNRILHELAIEEKEIIPVVLYSIVQPLSLPSLRTVYNVSPNILLLTPNGLKELINKQEM